MKIRKKTLKRLLFVVMLAIVLSNCCWIVFGGNGVYATGGILEAIDNPETGGIGDLINGMMSGIVGLLTFLPRIFLLLIGFFIKIIMNACVSLGTLQLTSVTFEHVFFSGYKGVAFSGIEFTDINFFDLSGTGAIHSFRSAIAQWYYIMRLISAAILLVILIYVGIRMAISTIASEQAKYKQMLVDWVTSLALLFLLHYIIMFIISINSSLISALGNLVQTDARKNARRKTERLACRRDLVRWNWWHICSLYVLYDSRSSIWIFLILFKTYDYSRIFNHYCTTNYNYILD